MSFGLKWLEKSLLDQRIGLQDDLNMKCYSKFKGHLKLTKFNWNRQLFAKSY